MRPRFSLRRIFVLLSVLGVASCCVFWLRRASEPFAVIDIGSERQLLLYVDDFCDEEDTPTCEVRVRRQIVLPKSFLAWGATFPCDAPKRRAEHFAAISSSDNDVVGLVQIASRSLVFAYEFSSGKLYPWQDVSAGSDLFQSDLEAKLADAFAQWLAQNP
jgi:hypothetical protein